MSKDGVYVVAELGVNWFGEMGVLRDMVCDCAIAGADAIKLQMFSESEIRDLPNADLLRQMVLSGSDVLDICELAHKKGLDVIVTPMYPEAIEVLKLLPVDGIKIRAKDWMNTDLVRAALALRKPTYISVPYTKGEIKRPEGKTDLELHSALTRTFGDNIWHVMCVPLYPPQMEDLCLFVLNSPLISGFSDHVPYWTTAFQAVAARLNWEASKNISTRKRFYLEVHVMPYYADLGHTEDEVPDAKVSMTLDDLALLVLAVSRGERAVG